MPSFSRFLLLAALGFVATARASVPSALSVTASQTGATVTVAPNGEYTLTATGPWHFAGKIGYGLATAGTRRGRDPVGPFQEIRFTWQGKVSRAGSIRLYDGAPIVSFSSEFPKGGDNAEPFPVLTGYPSFASHLSYDGVFGTYQFSQWGADGPWILFDPADDAFLLSPASHFMTAALTHGGDGSLSSGIASQVASLPAGFEQRTVLVFGHGINSVFETWGQAMTAWNGKRRPANDADVVLDRIGYWTDNGASYYYRTEDGRSYPQTLQDAVSAFRAAGVEPGYVQLDSWWYPKGHADLWDSTDDPYRGGQYRLEAAPALFPQGLGAFAQALGLPLVTHARWIDPASPYRAQYRISGNVSTDPAYWRDRMQYLRAAGVVTYEQDWLSGPAVAERNLTDPDAFLDGMALAAKEAGLSLQYCMPLPRHYLQGTRYDNLYTIRTSNDHFTRARWDEFLFDARLASSLGEWPWTDVFASTERSNLLISTLSGGPVGVGDAVAGFSRQLAAAARPDGVLVKPDTALVPIDATYLARATGGKAAFAASAETRQGVGRVVYLFAYARTGTGQAPLDVSPRDLGLSGEVYVYDFFAGKGARQSAADRLIRQVPEEGAYFVLVPIGRSGIAVLGDTSKFVSLGKKRIAISDDGEVDLKLSFAPGEAAVTISLDSAARPIVSAVSGAVESLAFDAGPDLWRLTVAPAAGQSGAELEIGRR
jgi:hypothetical protein